MMDYGAMVRTLLHLISAILISLAINIILHEIGHLIGGLLTGWRFLYLQLYTLVLKREDKGFKLMIASDKGFKCIMYPSSINNKALLYTMGGCIVNLYTGIIGFMFIITLPMSPVLWLYLWCFLAFGIGLFFMNGTASIKRVCNDKACYKLIKADNHNKLCHNSQFIMAGHLMRGLTYCGIGEEVICLCPDISSNDIQAYQAVLEHYYYLDSKNHLKMGQALNKIRNKDNVSKEVLNIIELEYIYLQLLIAFKLYGSIHNNVSLSCIKENIIKYSKKGDIHSVRVKIAYDAYVQLSTGNSNKAMGVLNMAIINIKEFNCIYEGEKIFCINQLREIEKIIRGFQKD